MSSTLHLIEHSPKLTKYSITKLFLTHTRKWKYSLHAIGPPQFKAGYQQQEKEQKAYKLIEIKQHSTK